MGMEQIIVAFESPKSCDRVREIVENSGTASCIVCRSAAEVKRTVNKRSGEEQAIIKEAKGLLMERHGMSEEQAHRFLQKKSMNSGAKMVQTAKLVLGGQ